MTAETKNHLTGILLVLAAMVLWSTVPIGTKLLVRQENSVFSPAFISAARLWMAALVFIIMRAIYTRRVGLPFRVGIRRRGWLLIAAGSVCVNYIFYAIGLRYTTAGATSVVSQVNSVATVLLCAVLLGERLTKQKVVGMALAMVGVLTVVLRGASLQELVTSQHFVGNLIEIGAALAWPFYAIGQTKLLEDSGNRQALMPIFVVAALMSALLLPFTGPLVSGTPTALDWYILLFLGALSTAAAYWLFAAGLQRIETSEGTMFNVLMPAIALLLAHWWLGEALPASVLTGMGLVLAGLVLIVWRRRNTAAPERAVSRHRLRLAKAGPERGRAVTHGTEAEARARG